MPEQTWLPGMDPLSLFDHQLTWLLGHPGQALLGQSPKVDPIFQEHIVFWELRPAIGSGRPLDGIHITANGSTIRYR